MEERPMSPIAPTKSHDNEVGRISYEISRNSSAATEEINLRQAWFILKHRLRLVIAVTFGVTAAVGVWTFQQTPTYEGKFQLLVGDPIIQQNNTVNQAILEELGVREVDYATQIAVLQSSSILNPIIERIQQQYPNVTYESLAGGQRPLLSISQLKETKILEVAYLSTDRSQIEYVLNELAKAYLRYSLDERKIQINQGIKFVDDQLPRLRQRVNARQGQLQRFRQQYNLLDPEQRAKELSDLEFKLQSLYIDLQVQMREALSLNTLLKSQLGLSPDNAIASSYLSESPRYQNLLNQYQEVEIEIAKESARYADDSPIIKTLKDKRDRLLPLLRQEAQSVLGARFDPKLKNSDLSSPSTLRLGLNQQYIQANNQVQVLQQKKEAIEKQLKDVGKQIKMMPAIARQYMDLQREMNVATDSLNRFLEAQAKLQIDAAQQTVPWQLISETAIGDHPVWPKPVRNLSLGLIAGFLSGIAAAFLLERLDPVFHSVEEIKENTQLPILGMIPWQKDLQIVEKVVGINLSPMTNNTTPSPKKTATNRSLRSGYRSSGFLEAFRSLNTSIWLLGADHPIRSLVISSATPSDGKSTVCLHLAQAAAAMGQKILLVDADLRRPRLHKYFGLLNTQGLSNVIATGLSPEEAIQRVPQWDNLSVLTSGDIPPDPIRLLTSRRMQELMESWEQSNAYDLIIYDTPPMLNFADARILGAATAGLVLTLKLGKTDRFAFRHVIDDLKMAQVPILGLVANSISRNDYGASNYYNHYRFG